VIVELDRLSAADLAHLAASKRARERAEPVSPWWRDDEPGEPDPETTATFDERGRRYLDLILRTTTSATEMVEGLSVFPPGGPTFSPEEVVDALVPAAIAAGLIEGDACEAVAGGIARARRSA